MENNKLCYKDNRLWRMKEEIKDLDRLLIEAKHSLDIEYQRVGGRTWWEYFWYILVYY